MKTLHSACLLALALAGPLAARHVIAADPPPQAAGFAPLAPGERERMLDDARSRRARAQALRSEADEGFRRSESACYDRIMVSGCISDAKTERMRKTVEARQLDVAADRIEREVKLREKAQREEHGAQVAPGREAEAEQAAARNREESEARDAERLRRDAERERDLQEAPARAAAESARRRKNADEAAQRRSAEARRARERADSAARRRAEIDRKAADHAQRRAQAQAEAAAKAAAENPAGATSAPR